MLRFCGALRPPYDLLSRLCARAAFPRCALLARCAASRAGASAAAAQESRGRGGGAAAQPPPPPRRSGGAADGDRANARRRARGGDASGPPLPPPSQPQQQPPSGGPRVASPPRGASVGRKASPGASSAPPAPLRRASASRPSSGPVRLSKALAAAGVASRRGAEDLITAGRVRVNGAVATLPQTLVSWPSVDTLEVDGSVCVPPSRHHYFAVHKPVGYLCSSQVGGKRLALDLLQPWLAAWAARQPPGALPPRLFSVGRLDVATSGLLLVTNDGAWAQKVAHPSTGPSKEYILTAESPPTKAQVEGMAKGGTVDGSAVVPRSVERVDTSDGGSRNRLRVVLNDGRNREVRVLAEQAGVGVAGLKRVRVGGLRLAGAPGSVTELSFKEAKQLLIDEGGEEDRVDETQLGRSGRSFR